MSNNQRFNIIKLPEVRRQVALSRSTIYLLIKKNEFPRQVQLSVRAIGWRQGDIDDWLASRAMAGDKEVA